MQILSMSVRRKTRPVNLSCLYTGLPLVGLRSFAVQVPTRMWDMISARLCGLLGMPLLAFALAAMAAESPVPVQPEDVRAEFGRLLRDLDADGYAVRDRAAQRLRQMAARPELRRPLAEEVERTLLSPQLSFEVRVQLERLARDLPRVAPEPAGETSPEEIRSLIGQLEDESYGVRRGATKRLEWLLGDAKAVGPIVTELRQRLSRGDLSADARQWLEPTWQRARGLWLTTDPAQWNLPSVAEEQIARWIGDLVRTPPSGAAAESWSVLRDAQRELRDLLARDDCVPRVRQAMEARLAAGNLDAEAAARLSELVDMCRPAMVAEFWQERHHRGVQHLLIGVPSQSPGAVRPSHFDRIDDETAHCVSGTNLKEGDYPVAVAIPHPNQEDALFQLVNLSTPRRRMAYEYLVKFDEARRLTELTRRTVDRFLRLGRPLTEPELLMLPNLDAKEVSRFAGQFLLAVDDENLAAEGPEYLGGRPSRHGLLCVFLAQEGTREAVPGLLEAIRRGRILPPSPAAAYELPWIAALAIAARDPWTEVDPWLAGLIARTDPLVTGVKGDQPELGATAAAALLTRHRQKPADFGIEPARQSTLDQLHVPACRFVAPSWREKVLKWWEEQKALQKAAG
jgi:hypothetical protein